MQDTYRSSKLGTPGHSAGELTITGDVSLSPYMQLSSLRWSCKSCRGEGLLVPPKQASVFRFLVSHGL